MIKKNFLKYTVTLISAIILLLILFYNVEEGNNILTKALINKDVIIVNSEQEYYKAIEKAINNYEDKIKICIFDNYDNNKYGLEIINKILKDNPQLMDRYSNASMKVTKVIKVIIEIKIEYSEEREVMLKKEKEVQDKINEIIAKVIKPNMKDYEKEIALHDYIVDNTVYDKRFVYKKYNKESNTAYSVLIKGIGACLGYSDAMNRLLSAVGIESKIILGDAMSDADKEWIGHAWNIVKLGGEYYHLDVTWDDPVTYDSTNQRRYTYVNLSDQQISKNHKWEKDKNLACNNTKYNFSNLNIIEKDKNGKPIIVVKNYDEYYKNIRNAVARKNKDISLKILDYDAKTYDVEGTVNKIYTSLSKCGRYSWIIYDDEIQNIKYITITFD